MANKITFKIVGSQQMHCGGCESTVTFTLSQLPQVQHVQADRKTQEVTVELTPDADLAAVQDELHWLGYEAEQQP